MLNTEYIKSLVNQALEGSENYLIDVRISARNKISIFIDNDNNVEIKDCAAISKFVENGLDREENDFELEVSSPGIDQPFKNNRQYKKNIGRDLEVLTQDGLIYKGKIVGVEGNKIQLEPEKLKKNKALTVDSIYVDIENIKEAKLIIKF